MSGGIKVSIEENKNIFCNRIRELRKQQNITLEELAEHSGVSLEMLEQLEQNILPEEMMVDDAFKLAKVFHCQVYELFEQK